MANWLASIRSLEEARLISPMLPDIVDIKEPDEGALGAVATEEIVKIVTYLEGKRPISATIGDQPMTASVIDKAIRRIANTGVDYIKVGLPPSSAMMSVIQSLQTIKTYRVIAVLFADKMTYNPQLIPLLKAAGFVGVMVDTAMKTGHTLCDYWSLSQLEVFIEQTKRYQLLTGLAGALRWQDIAPLQLLAPDYIGFRSALCVGQDRQQKISLSQVKQIQKEVKMRADQ